MESALTLEFVVKFENGKFVSIRESVELGEINVIGGNQEAPFRGKSLVLVVRI